jgi:putative ABC transport system permease protein
VEPAGPAPARRAVRVIRLLALRRLRLQPMRALLAAVVVGAGTSLVVTIVVIMGSLTATVRDAGRSLAGPAPLRVVGAVPKGGITADVVREVEAHDGVAAAVPMIQAVVLVDPDPADPDDDVPTMALGFDCRAEALFGDFGCDPERLAAVAAPLVGSGLVADVGPEADIRTMLGRHPLTDAIEIDQVDDLNGGRVVAFPLARAQQELGRGDGVDLVYVLPEDGVAVAELQAGLQEALGEGPIVLDALDPPPALGAVVSSFIPLFGIIALLALGIGGVLVRNSITLSLEERRRQTAVVGALGGSRAVLVWGTIVESVALGAVGGALGVLGGVAVARPVSGALSGFLERTAGIPLELHLPGAVVATAVSVGVLVALAASIGPARRSVRIDVAAELANRGRREEVVAGASPWRLLLACAGIGVGLLLCAVAGREGGIEAYQSRLAPIGFLVTMVSSVYAVATLVPMALQLVERRLPVRAPSLRLAVANLRREPRRTGVMAVALGFAMGVGFITASFNESINHQITTLFTANVDGVEVAAIEPNNSANLDTRLTPRVLRALAALPEAGTIERSEFVIVGNEQGDLVGVSAFTDPWFDGEFAVGHMTAADLEAGGVAIGPALARARDLRPGDEVVLPTRDGTVRLPVMAVVHNGDFGGRNLLMDIDLLERHYGLEQPAAVMVQPAPGVSDHELIAAVEEAELDPAIEVRDRGEVIERVTEEIADQLSTIDAIQRGLLVMSFIAVLSTLLLVGIQRQRELGMLAAVGMTPGEIARMIVAEAAVVAVLGVLVTSVFALLQYLALILIVPVVIGYKDPYIVDEGAILLYGAVAVGVAVLASLYPSRRAARVEVLEALRYE